MMFQMVLQCIILLILIQTISAAVPNANKNYQVSTPRRFYADPKNLVNILPSSLSFLFRLGSGTVCEGYSVSIKQDSPSIYSVLRFNGNRIEESSTFTRPGNIYKRPTKPIEIYEFEGCPFCKKVREAVITLDLDAIFYPCPRGGPTYRSKVKKLGGKAQFPYLVDPNTKVSMYESDDIISYLFDEYGNGEIPSFLSPTVTTTILCSLSLLPRFGRGSKFQESRQPKVPLVYWGYESSPFCKIVREKLNELEIPHLYKSTGRGSAKRQELFDKLGTFQVPYIEDPNTGVKLLESLDIIKYLDEVYGV